MLVLVLGSSGFVGKNLSCFLSNQSDIEVHEFSRNKSDIVHETQYDVIINCIGVNRSDKNEKFTEGNVNFLDWFFTSHVKDKKIKFKKVIHLSSCKAGESSIYGKTKFQGEQLLKSICDTCNVPLKVIRYKNLFGKWCKPDYNSVVATWCRDFRLSRKTFISNPNNCIELIYIDDVCDEIHKLIFSNQEDFIEKCKSTSSDLKPFSTSLQNLHDILSSISSTVANIGLFRPSGPLEKYLYSTYISYLDPRDTLFKLTGHGDKRGEFYEVFKIGINGQISVSSTMPSSEPRGRHFHMSKVEVFCLLSGSAIMRHKQWGEDEIIETNIMPFECITTIPGYIHDIHNTTEEPLLLLIWANEEFDIDKPDTFQGVI
jgi:UDP-2-acetamido-2,6-beta-L-arabino-hexul-4-ose reductase